MLVLFVAAALVIEVVVVEPGRFTHHTFVLLLLGALSTRVAQRHRAQGGGLR